MRCCRFPVLLPAVFALALGCKPRDGIQVYQAPRDAAPTNASNAGGSNGGARDVPWTVPDGWETKPAQPGGMRIATYTVAGSDGRTMDVSVVPLGGNSGSLLDNVNRWREQIGLAAISAADLASLGQTVKIGQIDGQVYDMAGDQPVLDGKFKARTLAAIMSVGATTVFFKATGEDRLVAENKPKFLAWLNSVQTGPAAPPAGTGSTAAGGSPDMRGPVAPPPSTDLPSWQVPAGWKPVAASTMRLASFSVDGANGQTGDLSVVALGPGAGGNLANVNRWRGQLSLPPLDEAGLAGASSAITTAAGDQAIVVDLGGQGASAGKRVLAAIVARPDRTWFYKLTGDDALVAAQKDPFIGFVKSVKYP